MLKLIISIILNIIIVIEVYGYSSESKLNMIDIKFNLSRSLLIKKPDSKNVASLHEIIQKRKKLSDKDFKEFYVNQMYNSVFQQFDVEGYNLLIDGVMSPHTQSHFVQVMKKIEHKIPHCDYNSKEYANNVSQESDIAIYPGGPFRRNYGFDLTKWLTNQLLEVANAANSVNPVVGLLATMSVQSLVSIVSTVAATAIDIIPPMIPPPIWILRPFPCLPMLTGMNCILSVLYPITIADFMMAHITDKIMDGVTNSFPAKYNAKVGKTSSSLYNLCATIYFGMYCASIFPMCWLPTGLSEAQSFPICFPQCLLVLIACPGFWLDDIKGPCSSVSLPPFCSFSLFINKETIPPQYTSYEDQHPYPKDCPKFDPNYDTDPNLFDVILPEPNPIDKAYSSIQDIPFLNAKPSLMRSIDNIHIVKPIHYVCKCPNNLCNIYDGSLLKKKILDMYASEKCRQKNDLSIYCHKQCADYTPQSTTLPVNKVVVAVNLLEPTEKPQDKRGHILPIAQN